VVVALALMTAFSRSSAPDRRSNPHIYVWNTKGIDDYTRGRQAEGVPHVLGAAPAIQGRAAVSRRHAAGADQGDRSGARAAGDESEGVYHQRQHRGAEHAGGRTPGILLGKELAGKLGVTTGDSVSLTMGVTLTPAGLLPRTRR